MAVCKESLHFFEAALKNLDQPSLDLVEMGDQTYAPRRRRRGKFRTFCAGRFRSWRTLDLHVADGVEIYDLSLPPREHDTADVITNFGTLEHVEPQDGQYNAWNTAHCMLREGGIAIHVLAAPGTWPDHCRYYYASSFYENFARHGYRVAMARTLSNELLAHALVKVHHKPFMGYTEFMDSVSFVALPSSRVHPINNPKNLTF